MHVHTLIGHVLIILILVSGVHSERTLRRTRRGWLAGGRSKPPGAPCALNPCTVENFCGTGRTCEIDENCRHHCKCVPGSSHELCREDSVIQRTTVAPSRCTFNLCDIPSACDGNRKCSLDSMCRIQCKCTDESTHESCPSRTDDVQTDDTNTPTTTTTSATQTVQKSTDDCDLACKHGSCVRSSDMSMCQCDSGWGGSRCDQSLNHCSLKCDLGFKCAWFANISQICSPDIDTTTSAEDSSLSFSNTQPFNICSSSFELTSKPYQYCRPGLRCQHGLCTTHEDDVHCECDKGAAGPECDSPCCLDCGPEAFCSLAEDRTQTCKCRHNVTGGNCSLATAEAGPTKAGTWYLWVAGVSLCMLAFLLVLLVMLPYCLWRHRVIVVMKIIHYFQGYEDDDDRQWDAFVSYKSSTADEKFVVQTLFPKLERELGFRLHVHFRDFLPGDTIADNILRAVLGSRRTILIVSPDYVTAEWTKFEFQVAQQEMLKRKHRIIPIMFTDVTDGTDSIDPNLKQILGSVTYLEWPKCGSPKKMEKFWKRLELSLPKKRASSEPRSDIIEDVGYHSIRPDSVDIIMESKKNDRSTSNIYTSYKPEPEETYDTINEAEMNAINSSISDRYDTHNAKNDNIKCNGHNDINAITSEHNNKHDKNIENMKSDLVNNSSNGTHREKYIGISNGGYDSLDV